MLVTDLLNVSTDFAVVTLVSEDTLEDFTEVSLVIDDTKHSQKKVGTFFWGNSRKILVRLMLLPNAVAAVAANANANTDGDIDADSDADTDAKYAAADDDADYR